MATKWRTTKPRVALDPALYLELREKSHVTGVPTSRLVGDAVRLALDDNEPDEVFIAERLNEPDVACEAFQVGLKRRGKL